VSATFPRVLIKLISCRESTKTSTASDSSNKPSNKASDHKNEGFLKSAWHKLTHQHDNLEPDDKPAEKKDDEEPPKKASGSGS